MIFFADPYIDHFTPRQFGDLFSAFTEEGMPSYWSFGPAYGNVIQVTILSDMLPISEYHGYYHRSWHAVFLEGRDPVFLFEWMAVTSTALLAGVILRTLMVRRRSYRPVGATRVAH